ncbi:MAG: tetratricopeptide repeat protein, partial [Myxococcaceae bacterium]
MANEPQKRADQGPEDQPFVEMEASLEKAGRVEDLIRLYESRSRDVASGDEAGHLLARAGELARERQKNHARAEELFRRALAHAPDSKQALGGLRALYEQRQDHASLADVLEKMAASATGAEAAGLYLRAADLHEQKLGRPDRAVLCCQRASRAEPRERQAYQRARKLFLAESRVVPAFDSLEHERAALGDQGLADDYIAFADRLADDPTEHGLALKALDIALKLEPKSPKAEKIQRTIQKFEHTWRDRVRTLRGASLDERDRKSAARLSLLVAKLFAWYDSGAAGKLKEALDRCFLLWPAMPEALLLIEQVADKAGDFRPAIDKLEKLAADTKERGAQVDLLLRVGMLKLTRMSDPPGALAAFERAAKADPSRADATSLAAELHIDTGRIGEGLALLEKHLASLKEKPAQVGLHLRLADLCQLQAQDAPAARGHLEAAFKLDAGNALAAFRLARLYIDEGTLELAEPLMELAVCAPRPSGERVALCEALAMACDEAGEPKRAFEALALALTVEPGRPGLLASVLEAGAGAGCEPKLALVLRRSAAAAPAKVAIELWRALAGLLSGPLERQGDAEAAWGEVLKRAPGDPRATTALAALKSKGTAAEDPVALLEVEAKRLEATAAEPAAAAAVYRKILAIKPDDAHTLKRLGASCAAMSQWDEVAIVAERLMALADTQPERQEWRARLAQLYGERLNRKDEAARLYLNLLTEGVSSGAVLAGLERLATQGVRQGEISQALAPHYAKGGDWQRQVASLLVQLSTVQDKGEQKRLLALLAQTSEKHLADSRAAFEFRLRGLKVDPSDESFRGEAIRIGRDLKAHAELSRFLADLGTGLPEAELATSLLQEAAELAEEGGAVDDAAAALRGALLKSPDDPGILTQLVRLYFQSKRFAECDQALRRRILLAEGDEKATLYVELAEVNAELARPREAAQALEEAIKAGASEDENLPRLCQLLEQGGRTTELSAALGRQIEIAEKAGDKDRASRLSLKRAQVLEASVGDKAEAVSRYADVLSRRPSDPDALSALEHLLQDPACREDAARALVPAYEAVKDHRKLVAALGVIADSAQDGLEKVIALKQAAYVHSQLLRQPEQAFAALAGALKLAPGDSAIRAAARKAAEDADALDTYAEVVSELVETAGP